MDELNNQNNQNTNEAAPENSAADSAGNPAGAGQYQYQAPQQPGYQPRYQSGFQQPNPFYNPMQPSNLEEPMSVGKWILTLLLCSIPCVNIIMLFVWAFGGGHKDRSNFAKAQLIWCAIAIVIEIILFAIFGAAISLIFEEFTEEISEGYQLLIPMLF